MKTITENKSSKYRLSNGQLVLLIALAVILIDQVLKFWVKLNFYLGQELYIASWFRLDFVQNPGMAFGWTVGSKLFLTLFRIIFSAALIYFVVRINKANLKRGFMVCVALVLAGAIGNIIDCMFYGIIFNNPAPPEVATLFPEGGGYGTFLHGQVVDMLHFPLFSFTWPSWIPLVGGDYFSFFSPVFNIADAAISVGIICLILFYSKQLNIASEAFKKNKNAENQTEN